MFKERAMLNMNIDALRKPHLWQSQNNAFVREFCPEEVGLGEYWNLSCHSKMRFHIPRYHKLRNNPNLNAKHKQLCNKVILTPKCKTITCANYPSWKF